ncbi:MAG TPA: DUF2267 domain-containing protein [Bradyrhizobium sp.]|nr:DUF2267 domain-containing protein [Bradyrhizobium sp.]
MDELTNWLASKAGIEGVVAEKGVVTEKAVGIILGFLRDKGPAVQVQALIDKVPGAEAAISASENGNRLERLIGGGLIATGTRLMALGLGVSEIQQMARELFQFGRNEIGADQMGAIIAGTPGLTHLV